MRNAFFVVGCFAIIVYIFFFSDLPCICSLKVGGACMGFPMPPGLEQNLIENEQ